MSAGLRAPTPAELRLAEVLGRRIRTDHITLQIRPGASAEERRLVAALLCAAIAPAVADTSRTASRCRCGCAWHDLECDGAATPSRRAEAQPDA
jgi:hypothetical protein